MKKVWEFLKEFSWPFGICGGAYAILTRFISPDTQNSVWLTLALAAFFAALTITMVGYVVREKLEVSPTSLRIEQALDGARLLLIAKNEVFGINMGANIYLREEKYERLIGQAVVETVQSDGITQLRVTYVDGIDPDLLLKISQNIESTISAIIVRAGVIMAQSFAAEAS